MFETMKKFFAFCNPENRKKFHFSIFLGVAASLFQALKIPAVGVMLQALLQGNVETKHILISFGLMLISVLGCCAAKSKATMLQTEAGYGTASGKRMEIAEHMRYLPMGYFNEHSLGNILSVTTNTMENLSDVGTRVVMVVTEGLITTSVITLMLFFFDWRVALFAVLGVLLYELANHILQKKAQTPSNEKLRTDERVVEQVMEYLKGMAEVKSYHLTGKYNRRLQKAIDENVDANVKMELTLIPFMTLQSFVAKLVGVGMSALSLVLYVTGNMELLTCMLMVICSFMVMEGMETAGMFSSLLRVINVSVDKANAILELPPMDVEGEDAAPASFDLEAENIDFSYEEKKIIDQVSVKIPAGRTTAIVGPSGGGKTTLCHLLSRFWDVDAGQVTLGGKDVRSYSLDALMRNFSFVFQNVYLFKDTVANNIRFGRPDAPMEEVIAATKKAKCHDFITALPNGYETVIGEAGGSLSGGEKQRISIARAMMKDAPIVILDEATANIDPENEQDLLEAIDELTREKTVILIAHRLKTVAHADNIIVVDQGRIVQEGTHAELMQQEGIYKSFIGQRKKAVSWKL